MVFEFKLPDIGEGVHEGEIVSWLVAEGDEVEEDQDIVEVMTDKATVQLSSPRAGTIQEIRFQEGDVLNVGDVFVVIAEADDAKTDGATTDDAADGDATAGDEEDDDATVETVGANGHKVKDGPEARASDKDAEPAAAEEKTLFDLPSDMGTSTGRRPARTRKGGAPGQRASQVLAVPKVRHEAKQRGIDLKRVRPTGAHGHITLTDLDDAAQAGPLGAAAGGLPAFAGSDFEIPAVDRSDAVEVEPLKGLRKRIAANMVRAKTLQPHYTYVVEVRADKLVQVKQETEDLAQAEGVKMSYLPFIVKAVVRAMKRHPRINAHIDEHASELVLKGPRNIGIAAATDKGLVVPVVKDCEKRTLLEVARDVNELAGKARDQKLSMEDISGGTFTITSLGKMGGLLATPILLHPQVAIMGVHAIRDVPVVDDGQVVPGKMMNLSFTFDHRVIDGYDGALFAQDVARFLEEPNLILLDSM